MATQVSSTSVSYRSFSPIRDSAFKAILSTEDCQLPIVKAFVSVDCRRRIEKFVAEGGRPRVQTEPFELELLASAAAGGRAAGFCDGSPVGRMSRCIRKGARLTRHPDFKLLYGTTLVILEMQNRMGAHWKELEYQRALVAALHAHYMRNLEVEHLKNQRQERVRLEKQRAASGICLPLDPASVGEESKVLDSTTITHVEHILLVSSKIHARDSLLRESVDGKKYIAEYRTRGVMAETSPCCIEMVYRVISLDRAPRECYQRVDETDFWASNFYCDRRVDAKYASASKKWKCVPVGKKWIDVPPTFFESADSKAFAKALFFEELNPLPPTGSIESPDDLSADDIVEVRCGAFIEILRERAASRDHIAEMEKRLAKYEADDPARTTKKPKRVETPR